MSFARQIRIRTYLPDLSNWKTKGIRYFVIEESNAVIMLDNLASKPRFRSRTTLSKLPNGRLANAAGQEFEIVG